MTEQEQIFAYKELRNNGQAFFVDTYEDADRIIEALEKQIPKKPKCYEDKFIHCPSCGIGIGYKWECYPSKVNDYSYIHHCYGCGQKIDWGNEDDRAD